MPTGDKSRPAENADIGRGVVGCIWFCVTYDDVVRIPSSEPTRGNPLLHVAACTRSGCDPVVLCVAVRAGGATLTTTSCDRVREGSLLSFCMFPCPLSTLLDGGAAFSSFVRQARGGLDGFGRPGEAPRGPCADCGLRAKEAGSCGELAPNGELERAEIAPGDLSLSGNGFAGESI